MANKRPSFLKRQKEQARLTRASEKRATRAARRQAKSARNGEPEPADVEADLQAGIPPGFQADVAAEAHAPQPGEEKGI